MVEQRKEGDSNTSSGAEKEGSDVKITSENAPKIVVVHEPTELVVSEGEANLLR